jgi:hypothetical protein
MSRLTHVEKQVRQTNLVFASSPYTMLITDEFIEANAVGGAILINLPALSTALYGLSFTIKKIDATASTVTLDGNGAETIDGATTFVLYGQWDVVTIIATPLGWRILTFTLGLTLVPNDLVEFQILDRSGADILNAATRAIAEANAAAQATAFSTFNYTRFVITIDLTVVGTATILYIGERVSGEAAPNIATLGDWSYFNVDDIENTTGISTTPAYQINIPVDGARKYTRSFRTWGSWAAPIVWCNGANARGIVYAQRFTGG